MLEMVANKGEKMTRENKVKIGIIITFIIIFIISLFIYNFFHKSKVEEINPYGMQDVMEYGMFFSSVNNINKYLFYAYSKNTQALLNILNKDYIQSNNINSSNILTKLDTINVSCFFQAKKMYYKEINNNYIYYILGDIIADGHDKPTIYKENVEYLLTVDYTNFAVEIYPLKENDSKKDLPITETKINILKNNYNSFEKQMIIFVIYIIFNIIIYY